MQWDSEEFRADRDKKLLSWFKGDIYAVQCFLDISNIAEVWDDLADGDVAQPLDVDRAFVGMMIGLNDDRFFLANREKVLSALIITLNGWMDANALMSSEEKDDRIKAYMLRNLGLELVPLFIYLTQGFSQMRSFSLEVREYFSHETFEGWEREHGH